MRERLYYFNLNPSVTISHSRDIKVPLVLWEFDKVWRRCNIKRQKSLTVFLSCFLRKCGVIAVLIFSKWIAYSVTGMETFCYDEMTVFLGGEDFQLTRQWQALPINFSSHQLLGNSFLHQYDQWLSLYHSICPCLKRTQDIWQSINKS